MQAIDSFCVEGATLLMAFVHVRGAGVVWGSCPFFKFWAVENFRPKMQDLGLKPPILGKF